MSPENDAFCLTWNIYIFVQICRRRISLILAEFVRNCDLYAVVTTWISESQAKLE